LKSCFSHGVVPGVVRMQVIPTLVRAAEMQRTRRVAQRRIEVDDAVESLSLADPRVDLLSHLLSLGAGVARSFIGGERAQEDLQTPRVRALDEVTIRAEDVGGGERHAAAVRIEGMADVIDALEQEDRPDTRDVERIALEAVECLLAGAVLQQ